MAYYKLDREGDAITVDALLQGMQPSKGEFLKVASAIDGKSAQIRNGAFAAETENAIQGALSPDRYTLFRLLHENPYQGIRTFAVMNHLPSMTLNELIQLRLKCPLQDAKTYRDSVMHLLKNLSSTDAYMRDADIHPPR